MESWNLLDEIYDQELWISDCSNLCIKDGNNEKILKLNEDLINENLLEKYKPKTLKGIIGNKKIINKLQKDLIKNKYKGCYLLTGKSGCAKTTIVEIISKEKKLKIYDLSVTNIDINEHKKLFSNSIMQKIILIDDIDLTSKIRKPIETKLKVLSDLVNKDRSNLIFLISNENKKSLFKKYKKLNTYSFIKNREVTLVKYVKLVLKKQNVKLSEKNEEIIIKTLIKNSDDNIRKILINLEIFILSKHNKTIKYTQNNKNLLNKNVKDKSYNNSYDIYREIFKKSDDLIDREKIYYNDSFVVPNIVYEYYLKGSKCKDLNIMNETIQSIGDGDVLDKRDGNFSRMPYINYLKFIIPTQKCGKVKSQIFFPACVSKNKKINNNIKKISQCNFNIPNSDIGYLYEIQKLSKTPKKEQIIPNSLLKDVFTI
jgi:hypothetical protein